MKGHLLIHYKVTVAIDASPYALQNDACVRQTNAISFKEGKNMRITVINAEPYELYPALKPQSKKISENSQSKSSIAHSKYLSKVKKLYQRFSLSKAMAFFKRNHTLSLSRSKYSLPDERFLQARIIKKSTLN